MQKTFFLKLKERELQTVFDFKAIEFIESYFNKSFLLIVGDSEAGQELTKLKNLKVFLFAALQTHHNAQFQQLHDIEAFFEGLSYAIILNKVLPVLQEAIAGAVTLEEEPSEKKTIKRTQAPITKIA